MRGEWLLIVALAVPLNAWAADPGPDEMVNNPPYANWSAFKPGTKVVQKETVTLADGSKVVLDQTFKLVERTKQKVVVEIDVKQSGAGAMESSKTVVSYPAMVKRSDADTPRDQSGSITEGKEQVDFKGKKIEAEWLEVSSTSGDEITTEKIWTARDVPGGIVKQTMTKKKGDKVISDSVLELVEFK